MKILSDFDGVLTEQTEEAGRMRELFRERLLELSGLSAATLDAIFDRALQAMTDEPTAHGRRAKGRVTAYADEDLFIRNNGLDDWAEDGDATLAAARERVRAADLADFTALANWAYGAMTRETSRGQHLSVAPDTAAVVERLLSRGDVELVATKEL